MSQSSDSSRQLPLTPFERYMVVDDRDSHPMTFHYEVTFEGTVDRTILEDTLRTAVARHPLLTAAIVGRGNGMSWQTGTHATPRIHWQQSGSVWELPERGEAIDLSIEPGLRVWASASNDKLGLLLQFHHACCDGIGALRVLGHWLAVYHSAVTGTNLPLPPLNENLLAQRGRPRWKLPPEPISFWTATKAKLQEAWKYLSRYPLSIPNSSTVPTSKNPSHYPGVLCETLSRDQTQALRVRANRLGVNVNDLLLTALFRVMSDWQCEFRGRKSLKRWLQINVPTSMRDKADEPLSATNVLGYAFLARRVSECNVTFRELLQGLSLEMEAVQKWNLGMFFLEGLATVDRVPGLLRWFTSGKRCFATTVLTNVGDISRRLGVRLPKSDGCVEAGGMRLVKITGSPPLRPETNAVFGILICGGRMTITIRHHPKSLDLDSAQMLLDKFAKTVTEDISLDSQSSKFDSVAVS
ncbi:hypothetical protein ACYFX5_02500 [Bremerella sp. T1]|uniref:hypothetical protein n=1 Tax=Bremerella sp. TYQ1 TaxID=3119568 RepID=UPI001CCAF128|nr:hypothetical protein [Bremerella volcania]UBM37140.1 hypothetical protein LA756_04455 [Bremerella volcania]